MNRLFFRMKTIGVVINGPLSYSHTFILNELKVWTNMGFKVILFTGYSKQNQVVERVKVISGLPLIFGHRAPILLFFRVFTNLLLKGGGSTLKLINYERGKGSSFWTIIKKVYKVAHILPEKVDFLHYGFANVALGKEYLAKALGAKMSLSLRGADIAILPLSNPIVYKEVWALTDKVRSISTDLYQTALTYGLSPTLRPNIIFQTLDIQKKLLIKQDRKITHPIKILTVARLHWKKGLEYSLCAIALLKQEGFHVHYTIIGSGEHEQAVRYLIKDMQLEKEVTLTGALANEKVLSVMVDMDIYIQPSIQEGFCNAVLEAQAVGLMVIASNAEGLQENVVDGITGWIVSKRDSIAIKDKVKYILNLSEAKKREVGQQANQRVEKEFYLNKYQKDWSSFFS